VDLYGDIDDEPAAVHVCPFVRGFRSCVVIGVAYMGINLPCGRNARWNQRRFSYLLPRAALFGLGSTNDALGLVHLLWTPSAGLAVIRFGPPRTWVPFLYLGIIIHLFSGVGSLLPAHGFRFFEFLAVIISGGDRRIASLVWRGTIVSAANRKNGIVYLLRHSTFHGVVFFGDHDFRGNLQPMD